MKEIFTSVPKYSILHKCKWADQVVDKQAVYFVLMEHN